MKLILTIGLPRSGKSTWAKKQKYPIVNPDSIRLDIHGKPYIKRTEPMVWAVAKYMVEALFLAGHDNVIVDATNTTVKRREFWKEDLWELEYVYFNISKDECIVRAHHTGREDLILVIERMAEQMDITGLDLTNSIVD